MKINVNIVNIVRILLFLLALALLSGCPGYQITQTDQIHYYTIDGMPCIQMGTAMQGGLTCDWSKWDGTREYKVTRN